MYCSEDLEREPDRVSPEWRGCENSEGMADDQKGRYIQYLAEQNQDLRLTKRAMELVLEDFMAEMKELKDQMSSMQSKHADLENRLLEEYKLRKSAERNVNFKKN